MGDLDIFLKVTKTDSGKLNDILFVAHCGPTSDSLPAWQVVQSIQQPYLKHMF